VLAAEVALLAALPAVVRVAVRRIAVVVVDVRALDVVERPTAARAASASAFVPRSFAVTISGHGQ
jgi:hypothetical protein